ncbi:predicted protein [Brucella melitensis bv. 1 str. 16M]|nr:predicted protein [Brucella melitensis bv. 1 str. 16M]
MALATVSEGLMRPATLWAGQEATLFIRAAKVGERLAKGPLPLPFPEMVEMEL